ncbi:hypothetical protein Ndes2526B_g03518 [Nannochloris sp. 'desiccata']|nr:hypothetical protein NADE_005264 [Chlorella desiccata (nom. nud.)]
MDAAVVNNPDGSAALLVPAKNSQTRVARVYPPIETQSIPSSKIQTNPFPEHDRVAMENLQMMQKQDAAAWAEHKAADPELSKLFQQDAADIGSHETFITYNAKASTNDNAIRVTVEKTDAAVLRAIAAEAAGPNPILSPPRDAVVSTPGMDWLERMRAEDAALQRAVEQHDFILKKQ